jgi:predicted enzyme related to lactoylglutathione lyase
LINIIKNYKAVSISLFIFLLAGCSNLNLPAITDTVSNNKLEGKIIWHDLITDEPTLTKAFYQSLFGWEFEELSVAGGLIGNINYTLIRHDGKLIGGMIDQTKLKVKEDISQWVVLMSVKDINKAVDEVKNSGGTVFTPTTDLGDRGKIAIVADPQGALLGFLQTKQGDPEDGNTIVEGDFLWNELWTNNVANASDFYQRIAEYNIDDRQVESSKGSNENYLLLTKNNTPRVGILANPVENLAPIWVSYIRVKDETSLNALVAKVEGLKGEILLAPQDRAIGGRVALIAGPSGAGIALQTWPEKNALNTTSAKGDK